MTRYDSFVLRSGGGKKNSSGMTCMQGGGGGFSEIQQKHFCFKSDAQSHLQQSKLLYFSATTNNSQGCATFQSLYISASFAKAVLALKVEEKQNSMWILSKIFQKQAAKQMAVQLATTLKIAQNHR